MTSQEDFTVQTICNTYTGLTVSAHPHQLSLLHNYCSKLLELFDKENKYEQEKKDLDALFFKPIEFLKEKYGEQFKLPKNPIEWDISNMEWALYRSQKFATKLGKEFVVDTKKATNNKTLLLSHILRIAYLYKREIDKIFNKILKQEKIQFSFNFDVFKSNFSLTETNK